MAATGLSSRAIIGRFYQALEQDVGAGWVNPISMLFTSDQESETYKWLGQAPAMREWIGGRMAKGFRENGITIANKKFEATLEVPLDWMRRDKTGQIQVRINELAQRAQAHWASLLTTLIIAGESTACYDGQYFFDTDHSEGDSGTQDNDITSDITTTTAPTAAEMETAVLKATQQIIGFKDDQGEPMNEAARSFVVMVPTPFMSAAAAALNNPIITTGSTSFTNTLVNLGGFTFQLAINPRLTWTTKFAVFRGDGGAAPFIRQEEEALKISAIAEGSEEEFTNDRHLYGIKAMRNVGYGYWQKACLVTFT
jgi:phage major head subunit gpT-like protein